MKRAFALALLLVAVHANTSEASCAYVAPQAAKLVVDKCTAVDTAKLKAPAKGAGYAGLLLEGTLTSGKDTQVAAKVWVPAAEKVTCAQVTAKATVSGTLSFACCDGDPNPPCMIATSSIFTKLTITNASPAKPVKSLSRAELEAEVEALRAENAQLRARVEQILAKEKDRVERLQKQLGGGPEKSLK
jgi:hypothetical protein